MALPEREVHADPRCAVRCPNRPILNVRGNFFGENRDFSSRVAPDFIASGVPASDFGMRKSPIFCAQRGRTRPQSRYWMFRPKTAISAVDTRLATGRPMLRTTLFAVRGDAGYRCRSRCRQVSYPADAGEAAHGCTRQRKDRARPSAPGGPDNKGDMAN